jgi:hypothetical protein
VVNQSDRREHIQHIILHDTEGGNVPKSARDLRGLGTFFDKPSVEASSTVGVDQDAHSARYVPSFRKAWAQMFYNSRSLSIEQIGFASEDWTSPAKRAQLDETARWIALWHHVWGVPIRRGAVRSNGQTTEEGVLQHRDLGVLGGGHTDVSKTYPMGHVLRRARHFAKLQAKEPDKLRAIARSSWERG